MKRTLIAIAIVLFAAPLITAAHGGGVSFEKEVGSYLIDIGYDPASFTEGSAAVFDLALASQVSGQAEPLDEIWVRMKAGEQTVLATGLRVDDTVKTTLLYTFQIEGDYTLSASFRRGGETLAEAEFPFTVTSSDEASRSLFRYGLYALAGFSLSVLGFFIGRNKKE